MAPRARKIRGNARRTAAAGAPAREPAREVAARPRRRAGAGDPDAAETLARLREALRAVERARRRVDERD